MKTGQVPIVKKKSLNLTYTPYTLNDRNFRIGLIKNEQNRFVAKPHSGEGWRGKQGRARK